MKIYNKEQLKSFLPHRDPMLLLDEAYLDDKGNSCGKYSIKGDEFFLKGHFPNNPVVPGVILCEILAQSSCLLFQKFKNMLPFFTSFKNVRFKDMVKPKDEVNTVCRITKCKGMFYFAEGKAFVGEKECVSAEFSFAVLPDTAR